MAQTLKFGNKTWATKVGSTLAYNDENGNYKPLPFAFTRSTSATRVNKEGLIEVVTNDRPRIDYTDTSDGVLLLEKAATNLITYSEDFSNAYWTKNGLSTPSGFISPDGTANAFKLVEDTSNGIHRTYAPAISVSTSTDASFSVFVKKGGRKYIAIGAVHNSTNGVVAQFDLEDGTLVYSGAMGTIYTYVNSDIVALENDWYKISIISQTTGTTINFAMALSDDIFTQPSIDNSANLYTGDGTSGVYIFGAMLEQNSVASSYIPTQGSASTRVAETATGAGNSEVFSDSQGVLFANIAANSDDNSFRQIALSNGTYLNSVRFIYRNTIGGFGFYLMSGGVEQLNETIISGTQKTPLKVALQYKLNNCSCWYNGFKVATDISSTMPIGLDRINFAQGDTGNPFYGSTKEIGYYDTILTDLELETLTSYKSWTSMVNELNLNIIYNG